MAEENGRQKRAERQNKRKRASERFERVVRRNQFLELEAEEEGEGALSFVDDDEEPEEEEEEEEDSFVVQDDQEPEQLNGYWSSSFEEDALLATCRELLGPALSTPEGPIVIRLSAEEANRLRELLDE